MMKKYEISDGIKDGIIFLYMQNGRVKEVELSLEQIKTLEFIVNNTLDKPIKILEHKYMQIIDGEIYD